MSEISKLTTKDFVKMLVDFTVALREEQNERSTNNTVVINEQEQVVDLFRVHFMDWRDQQMIAEARQIDAEMKKRKEDDPYGMGGLNEH